MLEFHLMKSVTTFPGFFLNVQFEEGFSKVYDVKPLMESDEEFAVFKQHSELFGSASIDMDGCAVTWDGGPTLYCTEIYDNGQTADTPFDALKIIGL